MNTQNGQYAVSRYRWVILAAIVPIIVSTQMFWLTLAPISDLAARYYHVNDLGISMFSTSYMLMFILFTYPASLVIDRFGFRASLTIGALLTAVFGVLRAAFAADFAIALLCQFMIAAGQPFLLNISTKVPANWFPVPERSLAAGLLTMAQYLGLVVPMVLSPALAQTSGIPSLYWVFAIVAAFSAVLAIAFTREHPLTAPGPVAEKEATGLGSLNKLLKNRSFFYIMILSFISMGAFNTVLTLINSILKPGGMNMDQAGIVGAVFVIAGIIGAVVLPMLSDKRLSRVPFFIVCIGVLVPLYAGIGFLHNYLLVIICGGLAGFSIMGVAPILFQHGAEVAYPVQEGASYGFIILMGQISGFLFILIFEWLNSKTSSTVLPMLLLIAATAIQIPITLRMRESNTLLQVRQKQELAFFPPQEQLAKE